MCVPKTFSTTLNLKNPYAYKGLNLFYYFLANSCNL